MLLSLLTISKTPKMKKSQTPESPRIPSIDQSQQGQWPTQMSLLSKHGKMGGDELLHSDAEINTNSIALH